MRTAFAFVWAMPCYLLLACSARGCSGSSNVEKQAPPDAPAASAATLSAEEGPDVRARLRAALSARGASYRPRTRHANPDGTPRYTNRLILESSPYLLQHAHNPVNWFAWGDEAFARAQALQRPVFLSVGYSTCHWCHVMEEESFEDEAIARFLNQHYVCIKVDREERPDIDATYLTFVESLTGRGGWPMSVWLTPAREPFFGGTYFPPRAGARGARQGLLELLSVHSDRFAKEPASVVQQAQAWASKLQAASVPDAAGVLPSAHLLEASRQAARLRFDPELAGARGAPKFPSSFPVRLLLRIARRTGDAEARQMALATLDGMQAGGIYDQIGGGFHRYSTDAHWLVPHFEKMLYDNALLALAYLEASQLDGDARYTRTAREVLDYLLRDMAAPDGTFYSATDADSPAASGGEAEGAFFTWTPAELETALGSTDAALAGSWFGVNATGQLEGRSVLHIDRPRTDVAREWKLSPKAFDQRLEQLRPRLLAARATRPPPLRDEKVIVAWNALTLSALARAAIVLGDARYATAALRCAAVLTQPLEKGQPLPHAFFAGAPRGQAFADDQAFLAAALLDVFEMTADPTWLQRAEALMASLEQGFADGARGGYFLTAERHERLLLRGKPDYDGPMPTPSSVAALTWLRLHAFTEDARQRERAEATLRAFSQPLENRPLSLDQLLLALDWASDSPKELVLVVPEGHGALTPAARPLLDVLARRFVPNSVLVVATEADLAGELGRRIPWLAERRLRAGRATAYVCEGGACQLPTNDPKVFASQLADARPYP
ncbi:MAG: thioredoxin domain-containing protein [Deltaproteobacteria bacterium]